MPDCSACSARPGLPVAPGLAERLAALALCFAAPKEVDEFFRCSGCAKVYWMGPKCVAAAATARGWLLPKLQLVTVLAGTFAASHTFHAKGIGTIMEQPVQPHLACCQTRSICLAMLGGTAILILLQQVYVYVECFYLKLLVLRRCATTTMAGTVQP
jgi:hypothetical protein